MAIQVQLRRGTATQNNAFTGAIGEVSFDTTNNQLRVHDGSTAGGFKIGTGNFPTGTNNVALGNTALDSLDASSPGGNNTAVGHDALTANSTASFNTAIGVSSGSLITTGQKNTIVGSFDGNESGLDIRTSSNYIVLSDGDGNPRLIIDDNGNVDIGHETTELKLKNTTHEDTEGGRESKLTFQGEQSGGEVSVLAEIEVSHHGTADDQKGKIQIKVNDGNDGTSPTLSTQIGSDGGVHITPELQSPLIVENPASASQGAYIKIRDGNSTAGQYTWLGRSTNSTYIYANNNDLGMQITGGSSGAGIVTMPNQPSFLAQLGSLQQNLAINGIRTILFDTERFDVGGNYASNTFTAPVTGKYQLNVELRLDNVDTAATYLHLYLITSNRTYFTIMDPNFSSDLAYHSISTSVLADMDANDTAYVGLYVANGAAQTDVNQDSNFSGILVG